MKKGNQRALLALSYNYSKVTNLLRVFKRQRFQNLAQNVLHLLVENGKKLMLSQSYVNNDYQFNFQNERVLVALVSSEFRNSYFRNFDPRRINCQSTIV